MSSLSRQSGNRWLLRRRPWHIVLLYRDFARVFAKFKAIYLAYVKSGSVSFAELENLIGTESDKGRLWLLKDRCHLLWRQEDGRNIEGCLLDLVLGTLFHESMKLKENIYLRERYRPHLEQYMHRLAEAEKGGRGPGTIPFKGVEWDRYLLRSGGESSSQMESLSFLFGQANYLLRLLLADETGNKLLLRYLVENEQEVEDCWHETLDELFADLFDGRAEVGYCAAAHGFREGHWYERAKEAFARALQIDPQCQEAMRQIPGLAVLTDLRDRLGQD